jgi:ferritin-like metal-binding protein YciE/hemerythrin-like domain-containing protein
MIPIADPGVGEPVSLGAALIADKKVRPDATLLLIQDHREAMGYFSWYEAAADKATRIAVAKKLCATLRAHMQVEEEIFYPLAREATGDDALVGHAIEEHAEARKLVQRAEADMERGKAPDEAIAALKPAIEDHVEDEENKLFPELREADLDLYDLGRRVAARKVELLFELTGRKRSRKKESEKMPISKDEAHDLFLAGLRDVHAAGSQCKEMVTLLIDRIESYPKVAERLRERLKEKNAQLKRIEDVMSSVGGKRAKLKTKARKATADVMAVTHAGTEDGILKNSIYSFGLANFEAASYESLLVLGAAAGHSEAVKKLQPSLSEERAMAAWLGGNLRGVIYDHLQLRSEGRQASH